MTLHGCVEHYQLGSKCELGHEDVSPWHKKTTIERCRDESVVNHLECQVTPRIRERYRGIRERFRVVGRCRLCLDGLCLSPGSDRSEAEWRWKVCCSIRLGSPIGMIGDCITLLARPFYGVSELRCISASPFFRMGTSIHRIPLVFYVIVGSIA